MSIIVISPSGRFYGSEQVLCDYLYQTNLHFNLFIPKIGILKNKVDPLKKKHRVRLFSSIFLFYSKLFVWLLFDKYNSVYCNEGGHIKYFNLLARLFKNKFFFIHIRINEDTDSARWSLPIPKNLHVLAISKFIQQKINFPNTLIYDPYKFEDNVKENLQLTKTLRIGVIGRISYSKGLAYLVDLIKTIDNDLNYEFLLFGDVDEDVLNDGTVNLLKSYSNVKLMGFYEHQLEMYQSVNCIMHFCIDEPLGRIFFEAINLNMPFIGFNSGGIGETGKIIGLTALLVEPNDPNINEIFLEKLNKIRLEYLDLCNDIKFKKKVAETTFNLEKYTTKLDSILTMKLS